MSTEARDQAVKDVINKINQTFAALIQQSGLGKHYRVTSETGEVDLEAQDVSGIVSNDLLSMVRKEELEGIVLANTLAQSIQEAGDLALQLKIRHIVHDSVGACMDYEAGKNQLIQRAKATNEAVMNALGLLESTEAEILAHLKESNALVKDMESKIRQEKERELRDSKDRDHG